MDARRAAAVALNIISYAFRIAGILLCVLTVILCFSGLVGRLGLVQFTVDLSRALPSVIAGWGVIASPFGGVFRFDFALVAAALYLLDFICARSARALR